MTRRLLCLYFLLLVVWTGCVSDPPFLSGYIRRSSLAVLTECQPYDKNNTHSCVVLASENSNKLTVYDITKRELVLAPIKYFPLEVPVGNNTVDMSVVAGGAPFILVLDAKNEMRAVRVVADSNKKKRTFSAPETISLGFSAAPLSFAAFKQKNQVYVLFTFAQEQKIRVLVLDPVLGEIIPGKNAEIILSSLPTRIKISPDLKFAVLNNQQDNFISILDLANFDQVITQNNNPVISNLDTGFMTDNFELSQRNFGAGDKLYGLFSEYHGRKLALVDITSSNLENSIAISQDPSALYFPDKNSRSCCDKENKNWVAVATLQGKIIYYEIANNSGLKLSEIEQISATSKKNMNLGQINIRRIIGGEIIPDPKIDTICSRKMFYISSYGNQRVDGLGKIDIEPTELESHGISCEGEAVQPLGSFYSR